MAGWGEPPLGVPPQQRGWSFECGGSSSSSRVAAGRPSPRSPGRGEPLARAYPSSASRPNTSRSWAEEALNGSFGNLPCAAGVTLLQPILPEDEQPLYGILEDETGQKVTIPAWPAVRLPMKVDKTTVLTLRLFRAQTSPRQQPSWALPDGWAREAGTFVAGLRIPAGQLLSQGLPIQCWCALSHDQAAITSPGSPEGLLALFDASRQRAARELCSKVFLSLKPLKARGSSPLQRALRSPASPLGSLQEMPNRTLSPLPSSLQRTSPTDIGTAFSSPEQQPDDLEQLRWSKDVTCLRAEASAEKAKLEAYRAEASEGLAHLMACRAEEHMELQRLGSELNEAAVSTEKLQVERERLARIERLAGDGVLRAGVVVNKLRERLATEQGVVVQLQEETSDFQAFLCHNNAEWLEEVHRLKRQVLASEQQAASLLPAITTVKEMLQDQPGLVKQQEKDQQPIVDEQLLRVRNHLDEAVHQGEAWRAEAKSLAQRCEEECEEQRQSAELAVQIQTRLQQSEEAAGECRSAESILHARLVTMQQHSEEEAKQHQSVQTELDSLRAGLAEALLQRDSSQAEAKAVLARIEDSLHENGQAADELQQLRAKLLQSQGTVQQLELQQQGLQEEASVLRLRCDEAVEHRNSLKVEMHTMSSQAEDLGQQHLSEQTTLRGQLQSMELEREDLQRRLDKLEQDLPCLEMRLAQAIQERDATKAELAAMTLQIKDSLQERSESSELLEQLGAKLQRSEDACRQRGSEHDALQADLTTLQHRHEDAVEQRAKEKESLHTELQGLRLRLEEANKQRDSAKAEGQALTLQTEDSTQQLQNQVQALRLKLAEAVQHKDASRVEANGLTLQLEDVLLSRDQTREQLQQLQAKLLQSEDLCMQRSSEQNVFQGELQAMRAQREDLVKLHKTQQMSQQEESEVLRAQRMEVIQQRDAVKAELQSLQLQQEDFVQQHSGEQSALQAQLRAMQAQREDSTKQQLSAQEEVQVLRLRLLEVEQQKENSKAEARSVTQQLEDALAGRGHANEELRQVQAEASQREDLVKMQKTRQLSLQEESEVLRSQCMEAKQQRDAFKAELQSLTLQREDMVQQHSGEQSALQAQLRAIQAQREDGAKQQLTAQEELQSLRLRLLEAEQQHDSAKAEARSLTQQLEDTLKGRCQAQEELRQLRAEVSLNEDAMRMQKTQQLSLQEASDAVRLQSTEVVQQRDAIKAELHALTLEKEDMAQQHSSEQGALKVQLQVMHKREEDAIKRQQVDTQEKEELQVALASRLTEKERQHVAAQAEARASTRQLEDALAGEQRANAEAQDLRTQVHRNEDIAKLHKANFFNVQEELKMVKAKCEEVEQQRDVAKDELHSSTSQREDMVKHHGEEQSALHSKIGALQTLQEDISKERLSAEEEVSALKSRLAEMEEQRETSRAEISSLRQQMQDTNVGRGQVNEVLQHMRAELAQREELCSDLGSKHSILQSELHAVKLHREDLMQSHRVREQQLQDTTQKLSSQLEEAVRHHETLQEELSALRQNPNPAAPLEQPSPQREVLLASAEMRIQQLQEMFQKDREDLKQHLEFRSFVEEQFAELRQKAEAREKAIRAEEAEAAAETRNELRELRSKLRHEQTAWKERDGAVRDERDAAEAKLTESRTELQIMLTDAQALDITQVLDGQQQSPMSPLHESELAEARSEVKEQQRKLNMLREELLESTKLDRVPTNGRGLGLTLPMGRLHAAAWPQEPLRKRVPEVAVGEVLLSAKPQDKEYAASEDTGDLLSPSQEGSAPATGRYRSPPKDPPPPLHLQDLHRQMEALASEVVPLPSASPVTSTASEVGSPRGAAEPRSFAGLLNRPLPLQQATWGKEQAIWAAQATRRSSVDTNASIGGTEPGEQRTPSKPSPRRQASGQPILAPHPILALGEAHRRSEQSASAERLRMASARSQPDREARLTPVASGEQPLQRRDRRVSTEQVLRFPRTTNQKASERRH